MAAGPGSGLGAGPLLHHQAEARSLFHAFPLLPASSDAHASAAMQGVAPLRDLARTICRARRDSKSLATCNGDSESSSQDKVLLVVSSTTLHLQDRETIQRCTRRVIT